MKLQTISDEVFVAFGSGGRQRLLPPDAARAEQRHAADTATAALARLAQERAQLQAAIESAALAGEDTVSLRVKLAEVEAADRRSRQAIGDARVALAAIDRLIDERAASDLIATANARIAAALANHKIPEPRHA
jgi:hypothetical protein